MRDGALKFSVLLTLALGVAACSEQPAPMSDDSVLGVEFVVQPGPCDLLQTLAADVRDVFARDEESIARTLVRDMGTSCSNGNQAQVTSYARSLLSLVELGLNAKILEGTTSQTAGLVGRLASCLVALCQASSIPGINFAPAVSTYGLFAVRGDDMMPAIAREPVPFTDVSGQANTALWGVTVDKNWSLVTGANPVLVYGSPVLSGGVTVQEISLGNMQYDLNVFPDLGLFDDGSLHVGVCFSSEVTIPASANGLEARLQRENVLLEEYDPTFCPPPSAPQSASLISPFVALARRLMPASITSLMLADTKVRVVGGTPLDFSRFQPVAAQVIGSLDFVSAPPAVVVAGQPLGEIKVRARSGAGTLMEKVRIELYIAGNSGTPAGAFLSGDIESYTQERAGEVGVATFPDGGAAPTSVGKAGGYTVCARGELAGFSFTDACTTFNARNAT